MVKSLSFCTDVLITHFTFCICLLCVHSNESFVFQYERLTSDNEDLLARIETLQANAKLLEAQILEVQKAKGVVEKELDAEKLQKEQKIKVRTTQRPVSLHTVGF
jgi:hypothetical protein